MFRQFKTISIFLLLFLIFLSSIAFAQTAIGKFTFVQGRVDVLRSPAPRAVPVKMGDAVFIGDIIRAKSNSKAEITFSEGNIVRVAPNTRVEISEYMFEETKGKGVLKLSRGKVQAIIPEKIAKRIAAFGEDNRFEIHTPTAIAGARGCNFIVSFQRNSSGVLVLEGEVFTYNPKFPDLTVTVTTGHITTIPPDQPPQPSRPATDAEKNMYEGDFAPGGSGEKSEAEDTVISEATTGSAEPGAPEPGPESPTPTGTLTETPTNPTDIVQPPPITETVGSDTTPPVITISGPPGLSNLPVSTFNVASDETVTFNYQMESWGVVSPNTTSDNFNLEGLPDGTYTLNVTATDDAGNTSTTSYTWTVDRTPPSVITEPSSPTSLSTANFGFNEPVTYTYSLDGGTSTSGTGSAIPLSGLSETEHIITVTSATDLAGNPMTEPYDYSWVNNYGPPTIELSGGPPDPTYQDTAEFSVSSSEPVTYSYTLDGSPVSSPSLSDLLEGPHTFIVIATDQAENTSIESYSWTTDYTDPSIISLTPIAFSPETGTTATVSIDLESSEFVTYSYSLNGGEWTELDPSFNILNVPEGSNLLEVQATDLVEKNSPIEQLSFELSRYSLSGSFYGCIAGVYGEASGEIAGVSNEDWGGWNIQMSGSGDSPNPTWTVSAGGKSSDNIESNDGGYWLLIADGLTDYGSQTLSGSSTLKYLSLDRVGIGEGIFSGNYYEGESYKYTLKDVGLGTYTETPLTFSGYWGAVGTLYYNNAGDFSWAGDDYGLIGLALRPDNNYDLLAIGEYYDSGYGTSYLWNSPIYDFEGGAFKGYTGGICKDGTVDGTAVALYIDPVGNAGYLSGDVSGSYYPDIMMWIAEGTLTPTIKETGLDPEDFKIGNGYFNEVYLAGEFDGTGSIEGWYYSGEISFIMKDSEGLPWGIYNLKLGDGNTFENKPAGDTNWSAMIGGQGTFDYEGDSGYWLAEVNGIWSDDEEIRGDLVNGKYLTPTQMGTIGGPFYGISDAVSGTWIGESIGTWSGEPLAFGGSTSGNFMYWDGEEMSDYGYSWMEGLMGERTSLFLGFNPETNAYSPAPFLSLGTYDNTGNSTLWGMDIGTEDIPGWTSDGGAFLGSIGGVALDDNLKGLAIGIYIKPGDDGNETGYIYSDNVTGNLYPQIGMYELGGELGGNLTAVKMGTTTVLPSELYWGSESLDVSENYGTIVGDITGSIEIESMEFNDPEIEQNWGIWRAGSGGTYNTTPSENWTAYAGGMSYDEGGVDSYWLGDITGTDWSDGRLAGIMSGRFLADNNLGAFSGNILGTYTEGINGTTWQALALGISTWTPLTFISDVYSDIYHAVKGEGIWLEYTGYMQGLMGGADSLWNGSGTPVTIMGEYYHDGDSIWYNTETLIYSYNYYDENYTTYDGGAYAGYLGGIDTPSEVSWKNELEGRFVALYIDPPDEEGGISRAGILKGSLTGEAYPDINMFEMDGDIYRTEVVNDIGIAPEYLYESINYANGYGSLSGSIGTEGWIKGVEDDLYLETMFIVDNENNIAQPWGIYKFTDYGEFSNPEEATTWTANAGGSGYFGAYTYSDGESSYLYDDWGYWLADITDGTAIDNKLTGTVDGRFLTYTKLGTIEGDLLGTYNDDNTWQAISLGTWDGTPLAWSGEIDYDYNDYGLYNNADGICGVGDTYGGLAGGATSPWSGTTSLTLIGPFSYYSYSAPYLWNAPIYSFNQNDYNNTYTTYDGGAFWGLTGGVWKQDGTIDAKVYSLYIDPAGNAGILKGSLTGGFYPDLGMFEADGTWTPTILTTGFNPTTLGSLTYSPDLTWWTSGEAGTGSFTAGGSISEGQTNGLKYSMPGTAPGEGWGIWQALTVGEYSGNTSDTWNFSFNNVDYLGVNIIGTMTEGTKWSADVNGNNVLTGQTYGYGADITSTPMTWISVGETIGTFDAGAYIWQAIQTGAWLETNKFLGMAGKIDGVPSNIEALQKLNIPCVEVGRATLTTPPGGGNNFSNLSMTDTIFFAPNSGAPPTIWATGNVGGTYNAPPAIDTSIGLTGGGLNADFTFKQWNSSNGRWLSTVNGTGGFNGSTSFQGAGAGTGATSGSGNIIGTAAGTAR